MPEFSWDHTHIKTYDVPATAAWLQKFLGAANVAGTSVSEARADLMIGGTKVIVTQVKDGDGVNATPAIPYAGFEHFGLGVKDLDKVAADLKAQGVATILVEQRVEAVISVADRVAFMENGRITGMVTAKELEADRRLIDRYVGLGA